MRWSKMHFISLEINCFFLSKREKKHSIQKYTNMTCFNMLHLKVQNERICIKLIKHCAVLAIMYILIPFWSIEAWQNKCFHYISACFSSENYISSYLSIDLIPPNNNNNNNNNIKKKIKMEGHIKRNSQTTTIAKNKKPFHTFKDC